MAYLRAWSANLGRLQIVKIRARQRITRTNLRSRVLSEYCGTEGWLSFLIACRNFEEEMQDVYHGSCAGQEKNLAHKE
ncbi:hypothetical protein Bpfe_024529 [Biomphalaria pfeifferi]|uniref:Uncharacterized protein n=1 Tax=Biomphalaria pfeifferi TaxID=112525 RepID=A0AAD8F0E3_BIOPF|nr:hypothetical protein Bpfe_024529 [Biomphalaria pfeifferi]